MTVTHSTIGDIQDMWMCGLENSPAYSLFLLRLVGLSSDSSLEIEARKYPDPLTHLVGIYIFKSRSKEEKDLGV